MSNTVKVINHFVVQRLYEMMNSERGLIFARICLRASGYTPDGTLTSASYVLRYLANVIYLCQSYQVGKYLGPPAPVLFLSWTWDLIGVVNHQNSFLLIWFIIETAMILLFLKLEFKNKPLLYGLFFPTTIFLLISFEIFTSEIAHGLLSAMIINLLTSVVFTIQIMDFWKQKEESSEFISWVFLLAGICRQIGTLLGFLDISQKIQVNLFLLYTMTLCAIWDTAYNVITLRLCRHFEKQQLPHQNYKQKLLNLEQGHDILCTPLLY